MSAVLRRALTRALGPRILPLTLDAWVGPDGFDSERLPAAFASASPLDLAVCLADQIERVLGDEAGVTFRDALAAVPGMRDTLSLP